MSFSVTTCMKCRNNEICKICDILTEHQIVNKAMIACLYYHKMDGNDNIQTQDVVDYDVKTAQDRAEISNMIHELSGDNESKEEIVQPSEDKECHICKTKNIQLVKCSSCGNYICNACCTYTPDGILCDECF